MWQSEFKHLLRIRKSNHHARCNQCVRHRLIIKKLSSCAAARRAQVAELQKHLRRQYADRQQYWHQRSLSRISSASSCPEVVTCIIDSMDQGKHAWPRSASMQAKEFCNWSRPRLSSTTLLIHGFQCLTVMSPHFVTCNSSRTIEIIASGLTRLVQAGYDLRSTRLVLQGDNASKELKNNSVLQWAGAMVALKHVQECTISFLSSGHSHEDIDALFSLYSSWLDQRKEIHTPAGFVQALQQFFGVAEHRKYESMKDVLIMSQFRDWNLRARFYQRFS